MTSTASPRDQNTRKFRILSEKAELEANQGRLWEALETCEEVTAFVEQIDDDYFKDRAFCCLAGARIALGQGAQVAGRLRRLLMQSSDPVPQHLAAYNLSLYYDGRASFPKSTFYARLAFHHARRGGRRSHLIRGLNRLANALSAESDFAGASQHLGEALDLLELDPTAEENPQMRWLRGVLQANLGSCLVLLDRPHEGILQLAEARRRLRDNPLRSEGLRGRVRLSVGFAYLQLGRPSLALGHAKAALVLASPNEDSDLQRKALYVLGEVSKVSGDTPQAFRWFRQLQEDFHPDFPDLADLLLLTETRNVINPWI